MPNASPTGGLLPHQLSETTFRVYEPFITAGVRNFPNETSWDIGAMRANDPQIKIGPNTFVARFRDAITSLRRFRWTTTVDFEKLMDITGKYSIILQEGTSVVWFKHKGHRGKPTQLTAEAREHVASREGASASLVPWKDATLEEITALCLLLSHERLTGAFLVDKQLSQNEVIDLCATHNVALTWDAERKQTVIT